MDKKVLAFSRLSNYWDEKLGKSRVVTLLFWSDGTVTWQAED
jgi:ABC-type oligopeptide transport system substrate-binding subunit